MTGDALTIAREAWGLGDAPIALVAERENRVYRVDRSDGSPLALRLHRLGYRSDAELRSELDWIAWLGCRDGVGTDAVRTLDGETTHVSGTIRLSAVRWLGGPSLATALPGMTADQRAATFAEIGRRMARLHDLSDAWTPPDGFTRPRWDAEGLLGEDPLWGRFWDNPGLDDTTRAVLTAARDTARQALSRVADRLDFGLIHADLVRENILLTKAGPAFIDFDDGGWGFRIFDVATTLYPNRDAPDYAALKAALLSGYRSLRPLDTTPLPLFLLLRSFTYLGWIISRLNEPGGANRNARFIANATALARDWLADDPDPDTRKEPT
jgi:Ser/Thr protein kinase RdoA (MazF antagonist)